MIVKELIAALAKCDQNAHVVINDQIVVDILQISGRKGDGIRHWPDTFRRVGVGRDKAVTFLHHEEMSDGQWGLSSVWT